MIRPKAMTFAIPLFILFLMSCNRASAPQNVQDRMNWTHFVRIGGHGLSLDRVDDIIRSATETGVFGIETDNDIPGRYESFLDPAEKLKAIRAVAEKAHEKGNFSFVYIAGLECITANADKTEHTFFKDHPDWVQRKRTGEPALFGGGTAFWIDQGDEDVWISPYASEWRKIYMERVRQIASTGIDGVYVDIPYWMTHFDGWEDTWASFDVHTVAAFRKETGLDAFQDVRPGDFEDPAFRAWVDFRIRALTDFMREIDENVKKANPQCMTIAEIYPGIGEEAVRVGSDVYELYPVVDAIAHEYSAGGYTSAEREPLDWFTFMEGMLTFRAFAGGKASWMLTYSWDGEENVDPGEAMKNLAVSEVMAGTNVWDASGHVMSGSNDFAMRKEIFDWIARNERTLYLPREPIRPIGVYFSPGTRNTFPEEHVDSYHGILHMLIQAHSEFQIVTPRTLAAFKGPVLILPDVRCISDDEIKTLRSHRESGRGLLATGETGAYDDRRLKRSVNPVPALLKNSGSPGGAVKGGNNLSFAECPGKAYLRMAHDEYDPAAWKGDSGKSSIFDFMRKFMGRIEMEMNAGPEVEIQASPFVFTQPVKVEGRTHVFIANFKGLKGKARAIQIPETGMTIGIGAGEGSRGFFLPFLGEKQEVAGERKGGRLIFALPEIQKGAIFWVE
jgi:hypothetical protein